MATRAHHGAASIQSNPVAAGRAGVEGLVVISGPLGLFETGSAHVGHLRGESATKRDTRGMICQVPSRPRQRVPAAGCAGTCFNLDGQRLPRDPGD